MSPPFQNWQQNKPRPNPSASASPSHPIPYGFTAVDPSATVLDAPMLRDGSSREPRYSGEILLSLRALTPLIVGNQQHKLDEKHSLLEPQRLPDGRVLLAGSSLKGMLRSALASLLHAPMDKVAEHHYSYRPNLGFAQGAAAREFRVAVVTSVSMSATKPENGHPAKHEEVCIRLLPKGTQVVFVRSGAYEKLQHHLGPEAAEPGSHINRSMAGLKISQDEERDHLESVQTSQPCTLNHYLLGYRGGIDGTGVLARAFPKKVPYGAQAQAHDERGRVYQHVLVDAASYDKAQPLPANPPLKLSPELLRAYEHTQALLADDKCGHLSPGHPLASKLDVGKVKQQILANARLQPQQLIYLEVENISKPDGTKSLRILSLGHHFHYRWGYTSSVRRTNRLIDGDKAKLRPELALHALEQPAPDAPKGDAPPQQLSAARLLFGYCVDGSNRDQNGYCADATSSGPNQLARGNFQRMAGRISFNCALEQPGSKTLAERFVNAGAELQLKVLGMPRPSAVEFYVQQPEFEKPTPPKRLHTYGDTLADSGGPLAGRKHYRHQGSAKSEHRLFLAPTSSTGADANAQERGTCVRYLSQPGSTFRTTLRFDSLRPWELGALLAALDPALLEALASGQPLPTGSSSASAPKFAHKLGYGKPLGLGSVSLHIDGARWRCNDGWHWQQTPSPQPNPPSATEPAPQTATQPGSQSAAPAPAPGTCSAWAELQQSCLQALHAKLQAAWGESLRNKIDKWLKLREWSENSRAAYPVAPLDDKPESKDKLTIYNFHTNLRRAHAVARRSEKPNPQAFDNLQQLLHPKRPVAR